MNHKGKKTWMEAAQNHMQRITVTHDTWTMSGTTWTRVGEVVTRSNTDMDGFCC